MLNVPFNLALPCQVPRCDRVSMLFVLASRSSGLPSFGSTVCGLGASPLTAAYGSYPIEFVHMLCVFKDAEVVNLLPAGMRRGFPAVDGMPEERLESGVSHPSEGGAKGKFFQL